MGLGREIGAVAGEGVFNKAGDLVELVIQVICVIRIRSDVKNGIGLYYRRKF